MTTSHLSAGLAGGRSHWAAMSSVARSLRGGGLACRVVFATLFTMSGLAVAAVGPAAADSYVPISGAGSTWSQNAIDQWRRDVQPIGLRVNYAGTGSSDGRRQFLNGTVDFGVSDIPFQAHPEDGSPPEVPPPGSYAYLPVSAGGTAFMYNLAALGKRVTNLRLSGDNLTKIFTRVITNWNDPALAADNPGLALPAEPIVPVVRSDGTGPTAELTAWMINQHPDLWAPYCQRSGRAPACGTTSYYPTVSGMVAQAGDLGVAGYVSQSYAEGAIGYVNDSYALNAGFPVAKVLNAAGYYSEPTPDNVAVSLVQAQVNTDPSSANYLTEQLDGVYIDADPRAYPLSSYSYMIVPTTLQGQFTTAKGTSLGAFAYYGLCQGQQESAALGYAPMPINLVQAAFDQIRRIPGVVVQNIDIRQCNNPTFSADGTNVLAANAPYPQACDRQGPSQCASPGVPSFTSARSATFRAGVDQTFVVSVTANPLPTITESGALPAGVTFEDHGNATATLSGAATQSGVFPLTFTAANTAGSTTQSFFLTGEPASPAPSIGYHFAASDGGIFSFNAPFYGSTSNIHLNRPIVAMAATPTGDGYYLVASDGGIFTFGPGAHFAGSTGIVPLTKPIVGMAVDPITGGYWLVASDGGIFSFNAPFFGSTGGVRLNRPIVAMAAAPGGDGYYLVASDGGIFTLGPGAHFAGSTGNLQLARPIIGMATQ